MSTELLLTVNEAARRLGLGRSFVYSFIRRGDLPSVKIGGARRVLASDLEDFVCRLRAQSDDGAAHGP
jgi:excisionase family DNA binding protein